MEENVKDLIRQFNKIEKALKGMQKIPLKEWTTEDSILCQDLRMKGYKLLSEIHKLTEKE